MREKNAPVDKVDRGVFHRYLHASLSCSLASVNGCAPCSGPEIPGYTATTRSLVHHKSCAVSCRIAIHRGTWRNQSMSHRKSLFFNAYYVNRPFLPHTFPVLSCMYHTPLYRVSGGGTFETTYQSGLLFCPRLIATLRQSYELG
jgi:hypothetical protein